MSGIQVEVSKEDVHRLQWALRKMQQKAPMRLKNAINRTLTQANKMIREGRQEGYTIKAGRFKKDMKTFRASPSNLTAEIVAKGGLPTIVNFKKGFTKRQGGRADVTKGGLRPVGPEKRRAFQLPSGAMARRTTGERLPIEVIHGPSVPEMVNKIYTGKRGGQGDMKPRVRDRLTLEIDKEIAKLAASKG